MNERGDLVLGILLYVFVWAALLHEPHPWWHYVYFGVVTAGSAVLLVSGLLYDRRQS